MVEMRTMLAMIDELPPDALEELFQHIKERRQVLSLHKATGTFHAVQEEPQREPADTIRNEVNAVIDEAISQVRRKRETQELARQKS